MDRLRPNPDQPRQTFNEQSLDELAHSITQHGLISPIAVTVRPNDQKKYIIAAGERRYVPSESGQGNDPAILTSGKPDEIALIENLQREDLNPVEESAALAKMAPVIGMVTPKRNLARSWAKPAIP